MDKILRRKRDGQVNREPRRERATKGRGPRRCLSLPDTPARIVRMEQRLVLLHGFSREEAISIMRSVRRESNGGGDVAFATTTPTNLGWKVRDLIEHVAEEHAAMRAASRPDPAAAD